MQVEEIRDALNAVKHPELDRGLVDLGMIRDVSLEDGKVQVVLALPFLEVSVKDALVDGIRTTLDALGDWDVGVSLVEMDQQQRVAFMAQAEGGPKQAQSVNRIGQVVAVLSGKGGVGKSSVAALLAVMLKRQGKRVGVLDADITGPSIPKMFGLHKPPSMSPIGILPVETEKGIKAMSINLLLPNEDEAVIWRGPLISGTIKQFWQEVAWGNLDYLIVDLPPGTSDASLTVMQSIPLGGIVLVTSPQDLAGMVVRKAARMAQQLKAPILGVVENMSYIACPKCGERIEVFGPSKAAHTANQLGLPLLGQFPLDPVLAQLCDAGRVEQYENQRFEELASQVAERVPSGV